MGTLFAILVSRIAFILITIVSISMVVVIAMTGYQPPSDPFTEYMDIMPGQPQNALLQRGFNCQYSLLPTIEEFCSLMPKIGVFSEIQVRLGPPPYTVSKTSFKLLENRLTYGDLVLLWGKPQIKIYGQTVNLRWHDSHIVAVLETNNHRFSYWTPITYLAFQSI